MSQRENLLARIYQKLRFHRIWWQLLLLFFASGLSAYFGSSFDAEFGSFIPETVPLRSVYNAKPSGLKGLNEIAKNAGFDCRPWTEPYRDLQVVSGTLIIEEPLRSLSLAETENLLDWVSDGNRLIYIDYFPILPPSIPLFKRIGLSYKNFEKSESTIARAEKSNTLYSYVKALLVSSNARLIGGTELASDKDGALITETTYGKGSIIAGLLSGFCANRQLQDKRNWDNFQFMLNLLSTTPGFIFFDERCHGYSQSNNVFVFLLRNTPGLVVSQLALMLTIALASSAQRFGPIRELRPIRQISNWQFVDGLANAYAKTGAQAVALEIITQDFKSNLSKILTLPTNASTSEVLGTLQDYPIPESGNLADFLADYEQAVKDKHLTNEKLAQLVRKSDEIITKINEAKEAKN